jgi:hypothetical protein
MKEGVWKPPTKLPLPTGVTVNDIYPESVRLSDSGDTSVVAARQKTVYTFHR